MPVADEAPSLKTVGPEPFDLAKGETSRHFLLSFFLPSQRSREQLISSVPASSGIAYRMRWRLARSRCRRILCIQHVFFSGRKGSRDPASTDPVLNGETEISRNLVGRRSRRDQAAWRSVPRFACPYRVFHRYSCRSSQRCPTSCSSALSVKPDQSLVCVPPGRG